MTFEKLLAGPSDCRHHADNYVRCNSACVELRTSVFYPNHKTILFEASILIKKRLKTLRFGISFAFVQTSIGVQISCIDSTCDCENSNLELGNFETTCMKLMH